MKARLPEEYRGGNRNDMMQRVQKMQEDVEVLQADLEQREYAAAAGGGMVKASVNGKHQILSLEIDKTVVDPDDVEMLQDLIVAAINEANGIADKTAEDEMAAITGGMNLPGLM